MKLDYHVKESQSGCDNRLNLLGSTEGKILSLSHRFRTLMESVYHADFSQIRVCAGDSLAEGSSALAGTTGDRIHLAKNVLLMRPEQTKLILAHELAHVLQQRRGLRFPGKVADYTRSRSYRVDGLELEANHAASLAITGQMPVIRSVAEYGVLQQFNTQFNLQRPVKATYTVVVVDTDVTSTFVSKINKTEGHEAITREGFKNLNDARLTPYQDKIIEGNRRVDVPKSLDDVNDSHKPLVHVKVLNADPIELQFDDPGVDKAWQDFGHLQDDNVAQKNHFLLTPDAITLPGQPRNPAREFQDSYKNAMDFIKTGISSAGSTASGGNLDDAAITFGNVLHCIQDSFSEAHTERVEDPPNSGTWCLKRLKRYSTDKKLNEHDAAFDDIGASGKGGTGSQRAIQATTDYLRIVAVMMFDGQSPDWTPFFNKYFSILKQQVTIKVNSTKQ